MLLVVKVWAVGSLFSATGKATPRPGAREASMKAQGSSEQAFARSDSGVSARAVKDRCSDLSTHLLHAVSPRNGRRGGRNRSRGTEVVTRAFPIRSLATGYAQAGRRSA